jgi:hypothetical protein
MREAMLAMPILSGDYSGLLKEAIMKEGCFLQTLNAGCFSFVLFIVMLVILGFVLSCQGR